MEQRSQALNRTIMCPVCPGESIDQSQVALAVQMRGIVERRNWRRAGPTNRYVSSSWSDTVLASCWSRRHGAYP